MDTTSLKLLAQAVQKMAWAPEAVRSNLRALRARGILPAITANCVAGEEEEGACCDPESDVPEDEDQDSGDGNDGTIDGERPDDGSTEKGMDGQFRGPDGELFKWDEQPCTPDDTWRQGTYYVVSDARGAIDTATLSYAADIKASFYPYSPAWYLTNYFDSWTYTINDQGTSGFLITKIRRENISPGNESTIYQEIPESFIIKACDQADYDSGVCTTSAPCLEDKPWPSDGKCQEALINGQFVPHPKDPDCASKVPRDYQTMCQNGKCVTYIPTNDGGHMRVTVDPVTRLPTSDSTVTYYDSDGKARREESYRKRNVEWNAYSENSIPGNWE
jgi:hypothetical protein